MISISSVLSKSAAPIAQRVLQQQSCWLFARTAPKTSCFICAATKYATFNRLFSDQVRAECPSVERKIEEVHQIAVRESESESGTINVISDKQERLSEIDNQWEQRVRAAAVQQKAAPKAKAIERYELEVLLDTYKGFNLELSEEQLARAEKHVEQLFVLAYQDQAPPVMSMEEFETYMEYAEEGERRRLEDEHKPPPVVGNNQPKFVAHRPFNSANYYLRFLFKTYWKRHNEEEKRATSPKYYISDEKREKAVESWVHALTKSHHRIEKNYKRNKLAVAMRTGIPLIVDLSYDRLMNEHDQRELARQLIQMCDFSSKISEPFHLYFTSMSESSIVCKTIEKQKIDLGASCTEAPLTALFPRAKLVYLSPDASRELTDYNPDDIFVVGGLVDKIVMKEASLRHAMKLGVRCARFPINYNARVKMSSPLNFLEVMNILNRFTFHGNIHKAICEGVSKRRLLPPEEALDIVNRQLRKANRLIGEPNFVNRQKEFALRRLRVVEQMNQLDSSRLRGNHSEEPHQKEILLA